MSCTRYYAHGRRGGGHRRLAGMKASAVAGHATGIKLLFESALKY